MTSNRPMTPGEIHAMFDATEYVRAQRELDAERKSSNAMSSDVYLDSIEYDESALDEMEAQQ